MLRRYRCNRRWGRMTPFPASFEALESGPALPAYQWHSHANRARGRSGLAETTACPGTARSAVDYPGTAPKGDERWGRVAPKRAAACPASKQAAEGAQERQLANTSSS